jgi:hypothetical protein
MKEAVSAWRLVLVTGGFVVWSAAFVVLYSSLSLGCGFGWQEIDLLGGVSLQRLQLVALFLAHLAAGAALTLVLYRARTRLAGGDAGRFLGSVALYVAVVALACTVFTFAGVFFLTPCI